MVNESNEDQYLIDTLDHILYDINVRMQCSQLEGGSFAITLSCGNNSELFLWHGEVPKASHVVSSILFDMPLLGLPFEDWCNIYSLPMTANTFSSYLLIETNNKKLIELIGLEHYSFLKLL